MAGYNAKIRPDALVNVNISFGLTNMNSLDTETKIMSITGLCTVVWQDIDRKWSTVTFPPSVQYLSSEVWMPNIMLENTVDSDATLQQTNSLVTLYYDATFIWESAVRTKLFCEADTRYYPYDKQTCRLTLSARPYTADEISLSAFEDGVNLDLYQENSQWRILSSSVSKSEYETSSASHSRNFSRLTYTLRLQRSGSALYGMTIFTLIILVCGLSLLAFVVPVQGNERLAYTIVLLLTYIIIYISVLDGIPEPSQISVLSVYMLTVLVVMSLQTASSLFSLWICHRQGIHEMTPLVKGFIGRLAQFTCHPLDMANKSCEQTPSNVRFMSAKRTSTNQTNTAPDRTVDSKSHLTDFTHSHPVELISMTTNPNGTKPTANGLLHTNHRRKLSPLNRVHPLTGDQLVNMSSVRPGSDRPVVRPSSIKTVSRPSTTGSVTSSRERQAWPEGSPSWVQLSFCLDRLFMLFFLVVHVLVHFILLIIMGLA
ncbi:neuronal acetylcholine receptor subunit alpha-10-like [Dreissena polymorpha]|nr:neuronal acetylcholine receptor subunit alpha-10-like [Dreissena polymorpha]